jgi:hypothetical protein
MTLTRPELLAEATTIAEEYRDDGYDLTLRQLYYQLVSEALIPNSDKSYKRVGCVLGDARLAGNFEMDLIVDRGRTAGPSKHHECKLHVKDALTEAGSYLKAVPHWSIAVDRWFGQPKHVSVWVEKEALSGVFQKPCKDLGVGFFACKGYPSHSSLWEWLQSLQEAYTTAWNDIEDDAGDTIDVGEPYEAVVLYFGDHDPDGWQIPRSAEKTLNTFIQVHNLDVPLVRFERVALNMDQIRRYNPPPYPAKPTSSRFKGYIREHRISDAWELDALKPRVLDALIRASVAQHWDPDIYNDWQSLARTYRKQLIQRMRAPGWVPSLLP